MRGMITRFVVGLFISMLAGCISMQPPETIAVSDSWFEPVKEIPAGYVVGRTIHTGDHVVRTLMLARQTATFGDDWGSGKPDVSGISYIEIFYGKGRRVSLYRCSESRVQVRATSEPDCFLFTFDASRGMGGDNGPVSRLMFCRHGDAGIVTWADSQGKVHPMEFMQAVRHDWRAVDASMRFTEFGPLDDTPIPFYEFQAWRCGWTNRDDASLPRPLPSEWDGDETVTTTEYRRIRRTESGWRGDTRTLVEWREVEEGNPFPDTCGEIEIP